jgi:hypothetical protein
VQHPDRPVPGHLPISLIGSFQSHFRMKRANRVDLRIDPFDLEDVGFRHLSAGDLSGADKARELHGTVETQLRGRHLLLPSRSVAR